MNELLKETETPFKKDIEEILEILPDYMRQYAELKSQQRQYSGLKEAIEQELEPISDVIQIQKLEELKGSDIAVDALKYFVYVSRLKKLEAEIFDLKSAGDLSAAFSNVGQIVRVAALDPEKHRLDMFDSMGNYQGSSRNSVTGKITKLNLDPSTGGFIVVESKRLHNRYQAAPLIDADADYQPSYNIKTFKQ
jgi:hypothetical protein